MRQTLSATLDVPVYFNVGAPIAVGGIMAEEAKRMDGAGDAEDADALAGVVIWASVSDEVDTKIREQIKAGVFPLRLAATDWTSGETNWLLDVIAPTPALATSVLANMKQVVKDGDLHGFVAQSVGIHVRNPA